MQVALGRAVRDSNNQLSLDEAMAVFLSHNPSLSSQTLKWYVKRFQPLHELDKPAGAITTDDLRRLWSQLAWSNLRYAAHPTRPRRDGRLSPHTLHGYIRAWRRLFKWLRDEKWIESNPAARLALPRLPDEPPKAITKADMRRLLRAAKESGERDYAIVMVLADTACRVGGLVGLQMDDLDLENGQAVVREKGGAGRMVYFKPGTAKALSAYLRVRPSGSGPHVFIGPRGPLKASGVYQMLNRLARRAGVLGRFNPHSFRHGWARGALQNGADISDVAHILGHRDIQTTYRFYGRWHNHELKERHHQVSWLPDEEEPLVDAPAARGAMQPSRSQP